MKLRMQMTAGFFCWCAQPLVTMNLLQLSTSTQLESVVQGNLPAAFGRGKECKLLPILTNNKMSNVSAYKSITIIS